MTTAKRLMEKYPNKIPIIIEGSRFFNLKHNIKHKKYMVSRDSSFIQFMLAVKLNIDTINAYDAIYFNTDKGVIFPSSQCIGDIYDNYKSENDILYLYLTSENTFG